MKIYLVTPANPPSFWTYDAILPTLRKDCIFPNLSLPTIAGLTPREHDVVLCDENVEAVDFGMEADVVGVTGYIIHRQRLLEIVDEFRSRGRFVVVGGPYASLCHDELRGRCDVVFVDEAEETWPAFLRDFEAGCWRDLYRPAAKPDMTLSPMPRFDLLRVDRYHAMTVQFARGCPFNCEFCDIIVVYGRRPRVKAVEQVMAEIEECRRLGSKQVFLVDDNFIGNRKRAKELLRALARWGRQHGYPLDFQTELSLDVAQNDELLELLREANFCTVFIGIESPRVQSLVETGKTQNTRGDLVASVRKVQSYGLQVQAGMIVGFDHDDPSIFEEQLCFLEEARIPVSMTGMLNALPQTPLYDRVLREGRLVSEVTGDNLAFTNIQPARMSRLELYRGYRWLIGQVYSYRRYGRRTLDHLLHRGARARSDVSLRWENVRLLGRILLDTVLRGGLRRAAFTLRLLAETLLRRPTRFPDAVSFAITHKALGDYVRVLKQRLDETIETLSEERGAPAAGAEAGFEPR